MKIQIETKQKYKIQKQTQIRIRIKIRIQIQLLKFDTNIYLDNWCLLITKLLISTGGKPTFPDRMVNSSSEQKGRDYFITGLLVTAVILFILVLMCMAAFVIFVRK